MMINKLKKLLLYKSGTNTGATAIISEENYKSNSNNKKKKRFSLLLKTAMIEPNNGEFDLDHDQQKKRISKSSSFLQLSYLSAPLKKSRSSSLFEKFSNNKGVTTTNTAATESAILEYYAPSSNTTIVSENILHTAAVSISSAYSTMNSTTTFMLHKLYEHNENESNKYLQLGIQFYEKGELEQASYYWKLSAEEEESSRKKDTASPLGIFFYGLALRHGWGCRKSPALAVRYLQKVANTIEFSELQKDMTKFISSAAKIGLLVLSIYELGEFFWHGWEVPKSMTIASYYFQLASNMGNTDAMNDLAFCYKHGHGLEKDDFKAAQLYRLAEKNGNGLKNNSWIWQERYDEIKNCA